MCEEAHGKDFEDQQSTETPAHQIKVSNQQEAIDNLIRAKARLTEEVTRLIEGFEKTTGVAVRQIDVNQQYSMGCWRFVDIKVRTEI